MRHAHKIIVLDRFARDRVIDKGIPPDKIEVIPVWSHDDSVRFDPAGREQFRKEHGLTDKFVVMYSGNHSPCHPLDTLLAAAKRLRKEARVVFCFIGGGSGFAGVQRFAEEQGLSNVRWLPYQPFDKLSASLSAGDQHVVVMGNAFVGIIHPCKIYNILRVLSSIPHSSSPELTKSPSSNPSVLYIGPKVSHISEILSEKMDPTTWRWAHHEDVEGIARWVLEAASRELGPGSGANEVTTDNAQRSTINAQLPCANPHLHPVLFSKATLIGRLMDVLEDRS